MGIEPSQGRAQPVGQHDFVQLPLDRELTVRLDVGAVDEGVAEVTQPGQRSVFEVGFAEGEAGLRYRDMWLTYSTVLFHLYLTNSLFI